MTQAITFQPSPKIQNEVVELYPRHGQMPDDRRLVAVGDRYADSQEEARYFGGAHLEWFPAVFEEDTLITRGNERIWVPAGTIAKQSSHATWGWGGTRGVSVVAPKGKHIVYQREKEWEELYLGMKHGSHSDRERWGDAIGRTLHPREDLP